MKQMYLAAVFLMLSVAGVASAQTSDLPPTVHRVRETQVQSCVRGLEAEMPMSAIDTLSDEGEEYVVAEAIRRYCALPTPRPTVNRRTVYEGSDPIIVPKDTAGTPEDVRVLWRIRGPAS